MINKRIRCGFEYCCNEARWHIKTVEYGYSERDKNGKMITVVTGTGETGYCDQHHTRYYIPAGTPFKDTDCRECAAKGLVA